MTVILSSGPSKQGLAIQTMAAMAREFLSLFEPQKTPGTFPETRECSGQAQRDEEHGFAAASTGQANEQCNKAVDLGPSDLAACLRKATLLENPLPGASEEGGGAAARRGSGLGLKATPKQRTQRPGALSLLVTRKDPDL